MNNGIFTTINRNLDNLELHYERLITQTAILNIDFSISFTDFTSQLKKYQIKLAVDEGLKYIIKANGETIIEIKQYKPWQAHYSLKTKHVAARSNVKLKRYPNEQTFVTLQNANANQVDDYLYIVDGFVAETIIANIFIVKDNKILTPIINNNILPGTIRKKLIANLNIVETKISLEELINADFIFITNSIKGIQPVTKVDNYQFKTIVKWQHFSKIVENI